MGRGQEMHANVHRELPFKVISAYPVTELKDFLLLSMSKPDWGKSTQTQASRIEWLKEWMDSPDDQGHGSAPRNDHSYKLRREKDRFRLVFGRGKGEQATVVARLKYDARDVDEWAFEEEPRVSGLELAICMHWLVDMTTPPHTCADCDQKLHCSIENAFDRYWKGVWPGIEPKLKFTCGRSKITDVYRWAKGFIESRFDRNEALLKAFKEERSLSKNPATAKLAHGVITDIGQNVADFLCLMDKKINFKKTYEMLRKQVGD
jgi:hypothetical protein